jgi:glyoxylase-like metal-dependent hydrolase (beta-lactamase superfamily II)
MARLGLGPETVARVVVTHLHYDHVGNLAVLPDAQLLVPARELDFWLGPLGRRGQFADASEEHELAQVRAADVAGRVRRLEDGEAIADGVRAVVLGGHTPGQAAVVVQTATGSVVLASDAVHFYDEIERDRPFAVVADLAAMYTAYDTLRELCAADGAHLVPGHDPAVMDRYPRVHGPGANFAVQIT